MEEIKTAEQMYNYCLKNNYGKGFNYNWGLKHFQLIADSLLDDEKVLMTFIGIHNYVSISNHNNNFAYAITNKRIIMAQKKLIGENFQTVLLNNLNDITFSSGIVWGIMTIDTIKEKFNIALDKATAKNINERVHQVLNDLKSTPKKSNSTSNLDELKKLKELLDLGAITQNEFDTKKKELLNL